MKQHFLIKNNHKQLLLFFAGWGMDETLFQKIHLNNCDWIVCYDYRSLEFDETLLEEYTHITLIAWSMGVWAASQIMERHKSLPISQRIAINGTLFPIDEAKGISPVLFEGTLQGLNDAVLQKFQRRMCGSLADYKAFQASAPKRPVEELKEELLSIKKQVSYCLPITQKWDITFIGNKDCIFLPENQRKGWNTLANSILEMNAPHYQDKLFSNIFNSQQTYE